jgi:hypothetical protein
MYLIIEQKYNRQISPCESKYYRTSKKQRDGYLSDAGCYLVTFNRLINVDYTLDVFFL